MPLEETSMLFLYAAAVVSLIAIVLICVCGCRKSVPKNELLGLAGKVKLTNPDIALVEGHPNEGRQTPNGPVVDEIDSILITDTKYRNAVDTTNGSTGVVATATRSLPDLPIDPTRRTSNSADVWDKNGEQNSGGDTGSDLYATVEDNKMGANGRLNKKISQSTNAVLEQGQSGSYASPTTDDSVSPYACYRKEHPYDKVKQAEHPYAQVSSVGKKKKLIRDIQSSIESSTSTSSSRSDEPKAPPPASPLPPIGRVRRPSWEGGTSSASGHSSVRDSIPAAGAISGAVAASNELPYMTPPIVNAPAENSNTVGGGGGPHFSGDSQDSGKGYTCISVREPLSNISRRPTRIVESSHYATVSDDSDETYEAIEEPPQIYTSGSETYAKIAPIARPEPTSPPQLPSVSSLRSAAHNSQTSLSPNTSQQSAGSSNTSNASQQRAHSPLIHAAADVNISSSPKLHLNTNVHSRQSSNSSQVSTDHSTDKQRRNNSPLPKTPEIIDDMYAKVMKMSKKSKHSGTGGRQRTESLNWSSSSYEDQERHNVSDRNSAEFLPPGNTNIKPSTSDPYESLTHSSVGYERINKQRNSILDEDDIDPNYEKIHRKTSNNEEDIGYAQINQHTAARHQRSNSEANYDNGYEQIHKTNATEDPEANYDMGYERIHHSRARPAEDNYERIHRDERDRDSPNYDVGYEQIHKMNHSDQDSNYDVRYEKIHRKHVATNENIPDDDDDDDDPNYEELKTSARETAVNEEFDDPNYEVLSTVVRRTQAKATNQNTEPTVEHNYASINKYNKKKYRQSEPNFSSVANKYENNNESTYECMNDCFDANQFSTPDEASHKRSNSVSRIEVEPNVFYSQVQKSKR